MKYATVEAPTIWKASSIAVKHMSRCNSVALRAINEYVSKQNCQRNAINADCCCEETMSHDTASWVYSSDSALDTALDTAVGRPLVLSNNHT